MSDRGVEFIRGGGAFPNPAPGYEASRSAGGDGDRSEWASSVVPIQTGSSTPSVPRREVMDDANQDTGTPRPQDAGAFRENEDSILLARGIGLFANHPIIFLESELQEVRKICAEAIVRQLNDERIRIMQEVLPAKNNGPKDVPGVSDVQGSQESDQSGSV